MPMPIRSTSAGSTPTHTPQDCLAGVSDDVLDAFSQGETSQGHATNKLQLQGPKTFFIVENYEQICHYLFQVYLEISVMIFW